jgi:hypothetical protein
MGRSWIPDSIASTVASLGLSKSTQLLLSLALGVFSLTRFYSGFLGFDLQRLEVQE